MKKRSKATLARSVAMALLSAMSIVLGKLLAVNIGEVIRISFENLPVLLAAIALGPIAGAVVGLLADVVGCLIVGYVINPLVTLGAVAIGGAAGLAMRFLPERLPEWARVSISVAAAHAIGSVVIKTVGLSGFFGMPLGVLMLWRLLNYLLVGAAESALLVILIKNRGVRMAIASIKGEKGHARHTEEEENSDEL